MRSGPKSLSEASSFAISSDLQPVRKLRPESDALSSDLKHRGFGFVGSTIVYAYMQAVTIVNDHLVDWFRYWEIRQFGDQASLQND